MFQFMSNAANGYAAHDELERQLHICLSAGYLSTVIREFRIGKDGYDNPEQFYAPFLIQFNNRERWIIYSTTSCRTDRIKGQQWDADNLKLLDSAITKAFLVYPDDVPEKEIKSFIAQQAKYTRRWEYSRIDEILSVSALVQQIKDNDNRFYVTQGETRDLIDTDDCEHVPVDEKHEAEIASENMDFQEEVSVSQTTMSHSDGLDLAPLDANHENATNVVDENDVEEIGRTWDMRGRSFERELAMILNDANNLSHWQNGGSGCRGINYQYFEKTLQAFGVAPSEVSFIKATSEQEDIGLLPSGGQPKTDVLVDIQLVNGSHVFKTISCKRTNRTSVSVHQYSADTFADVLDKRNVTLRTLLRVFQLNGTIQSLPAGVAMALTNILNPYLHQLCMWVLGGYGAAVANDNQYAQYLAVYRPKDNAYAIHRVEDYTERLLQESAHMFGTPFSWTFASGQRGKSIQLKVPCLFD